ncbi:MAG: hypothetical protein HQM03_11745 [Magnetococcales bacterium]|nr:hypothetical protein [Magnetococcales bacterium]
MDKEIPTNIDLMVRSIVAGIAHCDNLLADQGTLLTHAAERLAGRLGSNGRHHSAPCAMEALHQGERAAVMIRNLELLSRCPPLERNEWLRATLALDALIHGIDDILHEIDALGLGPDPRLASMGNLLLAGAEALTNGFALLANRKANITPHAMEISERVDAIEEHCVHSTSELLAPERWSEQVTTGMVLVMIRTWTIHRCLLDVKRQMEAARDAMLALAAVRKRNLGRKALRLQP